MNHAKVIFDRGPIAGGTGFVAPDAVIKANSPNEIDRVFGAMQQAKLACWVSVVITGWLAFDNIGNGVGIGVAMGGSIFSVVFPLETENGGFAPRLTWFYRRRLAHLICMNPPATTWSGDRRSRD
jgi:hypothetical protein